MDLKPRKKEMQVGTRDLNKNLDFLQLSTQVLNQLRKDGLFTDIQLQCVGSGDSFLVHSVVLASCSGFFRSLFTLKIQDADIITVMKRKKFKNGISRKETVSSRRLIPLEVEPHALATLIDFMYTGHLVLPLDAALLRAVISASHRLRIANFAAYAVTCLRKRLSLETHNLLWDVANEFDHRELKKEVIRFVANQFEEWSKRSEFLEMPPAKLKAVCQQLHDAASAHDDVLCAILLWVKQEPKNRERELSTLLRCVDVTRLSSIYIAVLVKSEPFVRRMNRFWALISNAYIERNCQIRKIKEMVRSDSLALQQQQQCPPRLPCPPPPPPPTATEIMPQSPNNNKDKNLCNAQLQACTFSESSNRNLLSAEKVMIGTNHVPISHQGQQQQQLQAMDYDDVLSPRSRLFISKSVQFKHDSLFALDLQSEFLSDSYYRKQDGNKHTRETSSVVSCYTMKARSAFGTMAILGRSRNGNTLMQFFSVKKRLWQVPEDPCEMFAHLDYSLPKGAASVACGSLFFLLGGRMSNGNVLNSVLVYDLDAKTFAKRTDMKKAHCNAGAVILDGYMYVIGGQGEESVPAAHAERNMLFQDRWEEVCPLPLPAEQVTSAVVDKLIYCVLMREECIICCCCYSPKSDQWTMVSSLPGRCAPRTQFIMTAVDGCLYAILRRFLPVSKPMLYQMDQKQWKVLRCTGLPPKNNLVALLSGNKRLWALDDGGILFPCNLRKCVWEKDHPVLPVATTPFYAGILGR